MSSTMKLAEYLFKRLRQLGVDAMHGVPGDYNLELLDYVEPAGLKWIGNANELNAGYAADGYARVKGVGALITTFGVGELSAVNAIAGAYAERAAVVHIVGSPGRATQEGRVNVHHTFNDGEYGRFAAVHTHVTVAQTRLRDIRTSPQQIDEVLVQCLVHSRPVYIDMALDLCHQLVSTERLDTPLQIPGAVSNLASNTGMEAVLNKIYSAKQPIILVDGESRVLGIVKDVQKFVQTSKWPTFTTPFGKSIIDETTSNFHGIYRGDFGNSNTKKFFGEADLVICFGPHFSSTNSNSFSSLPRADVTISFSDTQIKIGGQVYRDIPAKSAVSQLLKQMDVSKIKDYSPYPDLERDFRISFADLELGQNITQDKFWRLFSNTLRPGDIILGETGSPGYGVRDMLLPPQTRLFTPVTWLSIGYMLPATQGVALAQRELVAASKYYDFKDARTILMIGDGSFQMTVQELGTIIRLKLDVILFLINNDGYTIERCIHGLNQSYNDIARWRYLQAPSFFGADEGVFTARANTLGELQKVLQSDEINTGKGLRMVEVTMGRDDFPPGQLLDMLNKQRQSS